MLAAQSSTTRPARTLWARAAVAAVISLIAAMLGFASPTYAASGPATFVSDQADYPPGGTVVLTGDNWAAGESVHITVNDDAGQTWSLSSGTGTAPADPVANDTGSFSYTFSLPAWFVANYTATATGATTGTLTTTFTDSAIQKFDQCANNFGDGYPATNADPGCQWINGNLNEGNANNPNATYNEGDSTIQRIALDGLAAGQSYTLIFTYDTTKSSKHAYDYLTTYNASETWVTGPDLCQSITGGCSLSGASTFPIPDDPNQTFDSGTRNYTMSGGTLTAASGVFPSAYAGDTVASMSVTFTATNATSVLWFGAHVASQLDWGNGNGAGSVSGSPYHVSVKSLNGASLGNQDNQMSAGAVLTAGTVTIIKDAVPNSAQDFSFTLTNGATSSKTFSLDDDSDATLPNTVTYNVAPGTWTLTENATVSPWSMTNLTCTGGTYAVSGSTATLTVLSGKTITCTYTNNFIYKNLEVTKTAVASYDRSYTWTIAKSVDKTTVNTTSGGTATFNYTVTATPTAHDSNFKVSGTITVTNPNTVPVPAVTLADSMTGGTCSITGSTSNITVAAGATVTFPYNCTFTSKPTGTQTNTATATWTAGSPFGTTGSASGTKSVDFGTVTPTVTSGQTITVTDDKTDPANPVVLGTADASIPSSQKFPYSLTKIAPNGKCDTYTNTAWLGGDTTNKATATVTVCGGAALEVSKTAVPSFTRDWTWSVAKVAKEDRVYADPASGLATANYTVTATPTSTDSAWAVSGVITLHNPNSVALTGLSVTDSLPGATCATDPVPTSLAAGANASINYTCTFSSNPGTATLTNTVTASWADSGYVKGGTAVNTATATFLGLNPTTERAMIRTCGAPSAG